MMQGVPRRGSNTVCPCCGQTLPPVGGPPGLELFGFYKVIFQAVTKAGEFGIPADRLFQVMYGDRRDGGPDSGRRSMWVIICNLNRKLKPFGLAVRANPGGGPGARSYTLRKLVVVQPTTHQP